MKNIKISLKILAVVLVMGLSTTTLTYASIESSEENIDTLLTSTNPHDHIKALEIMEQNGMKVTHETINEYDIFKELNEDLKENKLARENEYSDEQLNYIENYQDNLTQKIRALQKESDEVLKAYNYTDDQIDAIRNFDGSIEMLKRASSRCEVYGGFNNYTTSSSSSSAQMVAAFRWNGAYTPGAGTTDIFAVTWSAPFKEKTATGYLVHKNANYNNTLQSTASVKPNDLYVSSINVPNNKNASLSGIGIIGHWIESGSIISEISANSYVPDLAGYAAYGLNTLSLSPNVSAGGSAGIGLSFSIGISTVGSNRFYP